MHGSMRAHRHTTCTTHASANRPTSSHKYLPRQATANHDRRLPLRHTPGAREHLQLPRTVLAILQGSKDLEVIHPIAGCRKAIALLADASHRAHRKAVICSKAVFHRMEEEEVFITSGNERKGEVLEFICHCDLVSGHEALEACAGGGANDTPLSCLSSHHW